MHLLRVAGRGGFDKAGAGLMASAREFLAALNCVIYGNPFGEERS
jgi:hypothetical protein